jgi:superfamily II DNA or RNA helicase
MDKYLIIQPKKEKEKEITEPFVSAADPQLEVKEIKEPKEKKKEKYVLCTPSEEQSQIIQSVLDGKNVIVDSVAGSGKTTTILHIGKALPEKKILVLTYNAKLKIETREKATSLELENMEIHSYHAFCVKYYDHRCHTDPGIIAVLKSDKKPKKQVRI